MVFMELTSDRCLALLLLLLIPTLGVHAQQLSLFNYQQANNQQQSQQKNSPENDIEVILVTGSSVERTKANTPTKISLLDNNYLANTDFTSQADILMAIPGIKVEGGGGELATNAFIRGLPSGGQFQFTPLNYDSMPTFQSGMTSSAQDIYYRPDIGIERVEFVSGGVSTLFGAGSVAGVINYISKKGTSNPQSTVQVSAAEDGRLRTDFFNGGPVARTNNFYYALSGFYRYDDGPLDTGLPTEGYQLRANILYEFPEGFLTISGQAIDDKVQFFLPLPLDGATRERVKGNNQNTVYTTQTAAAAKLTYSNNERVYQSPIGDGITISGGSVAIEFEQELNDIWQVNLKAKYGDYQHQFNLFLDGDGITNVPETQAGYVLEGARGVNNLSLSQLYGSPSFTWAATDAPLPSDYLLFANRLLDRQRDGDFFSSELNFTGVFDNTHFRHTVNGGIFYIDAQQMDFTVISTYLADFSDGDHAQLVNLSFIDAQNNQVHYSTHGVTGPGIGYDNKLFNSTRTAAYFTDQLESERWSIDLGVRVEKSEGILSQEGSEWITTSFDWRLAHNLLTTKAGTDQYITGSVSATEVALAAAAIYKLPSANLNWYANASKGYFFPQLRSIKFDDNGQPQSYQGEDITIGTLGLKFFPNNLYLDASLFISTLANRRSVDFENDSAGGITETVTIVSTKTIGTEISSQWLLSETSSLDASITYQNARFSAGINDNKLPRRQPKLTANVALAYDDLAIDARLGVAYFGNAFANDSNTVELASHTIATLALGYTWLFTPTKTLRIGLGVWNIFNSNGITEGSPRQGNSQAASGEFFVGRPVLPRRISINVRYDF